MTLANERYNVGKRNITMTDTQTEALTGQPADSVQTPETEPNPSLEASPDQQATDAQGDVDGQQDAPKEEPKKPHGLQKRIDQITWKMREAERKAEQEAMQRQQLEYELAQLRQGQQPNNGQPNNTQNPQERFDPDAAMAEIAKRAADTIKQQQTMAEVQQQAAKFLEAVDSDTADFLASEYSGVTPEMGDVILNLPQERGVQIATYLANNPDTVAQIAKLPPHIQAVQLATLENAVNAATPAPAAPPTPPVSQAPKPAPTLKPRGSASQPDVNKMSPDEYQAYRLKRRQEKGLM